MGKEEILGLLDNNPGKKFTAKQISKKIGVGIRSTIQCLRNLREAHQLRFTEIPRDYQKGKNQYVYWTR